MRDDQQEVILIQASTSDITTETKGYQQGAGPKAKVVTFYGAKGVTSPGKGIQLSYNSDVNEFTGAETKELDSAVRIRLSVGVWRYAYGEQTWFNKPET